jgi:hypothetical protein
MKILLIGTFIFLALSCSESDEKRSFVPQTITPILIGQGPSSGASSQSNSVITNQTDWLALMTLLTPANTNTFTETNIDFNNFQLLVAIDTERPDSGYSINISNITENETNITATVTSENSGSGFFVLSRPYHIVKIPRSTTPVIFQ